MISVLRTHSFLNVEIARRIYIVLVAGGSGDMDTPIVVEMRGLDIGLAPQYIGDGCNWNLNCVEM